MREAWNKGKSRYPKEEEWLKKNKGPYSSYDELWSMMKAEFGEGISKWHCINLYRKTFGNARISTKEFHRWKPEEDRWLIENYPTYEGTAKDVKEELYERFGDPNRPTEKSIITRCKNLGLKKLDYGRFIGIHTRNSQSSPIGTEYFNKANGYTYVKINDCEGTKSDKSFRKNWKLKQRVVWEKANGREIPKNHIVLFLDGDKTNFDPKNLEIITSKEKLHLTALGWLGQGEATRAGIEAIRAQNAVKDALGEKKQTLDRSRLIKWSKERKNLNG